MKIRGTRIAKKIAKVRASWTYLICLTVIEAVWITFRKEWHDPDLAWFLVFLSIEASNMVTVNTIAFGSQNKKVMHELHEIKKHVMKLVEK